MRLLVISLLLLSSLAYAADPFTGEPIPAESPGVVPQIEPVVAGSRDTLTLLAHIADGATKEVRALGGGYVVFQNGAWLEFYDVSDPFEPVPRARILLQAQPADMKLVGTTLYVALRKTEGLLIVDVSDPAAPVVVNQREGNDMLSVDVANGYAYCGVGTPGFVIINLADLTLAGSFNTPGSANGTAIVGTTLFVADGASGLGIYNVANPAAPTLIGSYATGSFCTFVQVRDNLAYLAGNFGLTILDVTNPAAPVLRSTTSVGDTTYEMSFVGSDLYLAGLTGARRFDITDPAAPVVLAQFSPANSFSIAVEGTAAFLAERFTGLRVLTASDLEALFLVPTAGFSNKLHLQGSLLHVVDLGGGVRVWDVSDPAHPTFVSDTATPANSQDLALSGDLSFVVNSNNAGDGMWVLDNTYPTQPEVLDAFNTGGNPYGVEAVGNRVYVANGSAGLLVADVTDPAAPVTLGTLPLSSQAFDVRIQGTTAYVATFGAGLAAIDVTSPSFMSILDQEAGWGFLNAVAVTGHIAWVAAQTGLRVVDITTPTNLTSVFFGPFGGQPRDVVLAGDLYLGDDMYGLRQVDVTNPAAPTLVASFPSADRGMGVDTDGLLVVLAAGEAGVYVFQIEGGVRNEDDDPIAEPTPRLATRLESAHPNPFNPQTTITFSLEQEQHVRLAIFDMLGRLVVELADGVFAAGEHPVRWNGRDAAGHEMASGTYVVQMLSDDRIEASKILLVR
jgi:hypothetical protein